MNNEHDITRALIEQHARQRNHAALRTVWQSKLGKHAHKSRSGTHPDPTAQQAIRTLDPHVCVQFDVCVECNA